MDGEDKKKKAVSPPKTYALKDIIDFDKSDAYSSIGKMVISQKPTAEKYGFGTSTRKQRDKAYQSKALVKSQFIGMTSPGPHADYHYEDPADKFKYNVAPKWIIGVKEVDEDGNEVAIKPSDYKPKYAHYDIQDLETDINEADRKRKRKVRENKFPKEKRFKDAKTTNRITPGPKYDPPLRSNFRNKEKFTFGYRRDIPGYSAITPLISTGANMGPGAYFKSKRRNKRKGEQARPVKLPLTSKQRASSKHAFPKASKLKDIGRMKKETYERYSSLGRQMRSYKKKEPKINFTKAKRSVKTGMFKDMMATKPTRVRIPHPKF